MPIEKTYQLYPKAIQDIESIYWYSVEEFGSKKASLYIKEIENSFHKIAVDPQISRPCDYVSVGLRASNVGSHVIFFKTTKKGIIVIRVLHKAMDFTQHI